MGFTFLKSVDGYGLLCRSKRGFEENDAFGAGMLGVDRSIDLGPCLLAAVLVSSALRRGIGACVGSDDAVVSAVTARPAA